MSDITETKSGFNPNIHGLRGVAVTMIFLRHLLLGPEPIYYYLEVLSSGVDIFFMISGYLIAASLIRHNNVTTFFRDRAFRIYPAFLILDVLVFCIDWHAHDGWYKGLDVWAVLCRFAASLFFLPGLFDLPRVLPQAWSLSYELAFYLLAAIMFVLGKKQAIKTIIGLCLFCLMPLLYCYPRMIFFAIGVAVYALERRSLLTRFPKHAGMIGLAAFLVLMECALFYKGDFHVGMTDYLHLFALRAVSPQRQYICYIAAVPGFFMFADIARGGAFWRWLRSRILQFLGSISYSLYLWHMILRQPVNTIIIKLNDHLRLPAWALFWVYAVAVIAFSIIVAWLSTRLIEKRLTGWLRRQFNKSSATLQAINGPCAA